MMKMDWGLAAKEVFKDPAHSGLFDMAAGVTEIGLSMPLHKPALAVTGVGVIGYGIGQTKEYLRHTLG